MRIKKITYLILLLLTALLLASCKKNETNNNKGGAIKDYTDNSDNNTVALPSADDTSPEPTAPPVKEAGHEGEMRSYLSGLWVPMEVGTKRPYAYQFNNFKVVSNQWGISQADIVYECLVEGGITRLLGIGENYTGDRIGSTRSARHYFVSIADEYDAIYIHYGGTKYARSKIKELGVNELDGNSGSGALAFYRDKSIKAPHNAFASLEGIQKAIKKNGFETEYKTDYKPHFSFYEEDTELTSGSGVNKVTLGFSAYTKPYFEYNPEDKLYMRFQFGGKHVDSLTGKQLAFKNIIIQFVKEWNIDKKGYQTMDLENSKGSGFYITNGKGVPITWKKNEVERFMRFYDEAGNELTINPGKTFITLFPNDRTGDVEIR